MSATYKNDPALNRVVYEARTPRGAVVAIVDKRGPEPVVMISRAFEDTLTSMSVTIRVHELRAILAAIDGNA